MKKVNMHILQINKLIQKMENENNERTIINEINETDNNEEQIKQGNCSANTL